MCLGPERAPLGVLVTLTTGKRLVRRDRDRERSTGDKADWPQWEQHSVKQVMRSSCYKS